MAHVNIIQTFLNSNVACKLDGELMSYSYENSESLANHFAIGSKPYGLIYSLMYIKEKEESSDVLVRMFKDYLVENQVIKYRCLHVSMDFKIKVIVFHKINGKNKHYVAVRKGNAWEINGERVNLRIEELMSFIAEKKVKKLAFFPAVLVYLRKDNIS